MILLLASNACVYTDSNGASNASVPTNTKNHQFPFQEIDGFLLVGKNPKPSGNTENSIAARFYQSLIYY